MRIRAPKPEEGGLPAHIIKEIGERRRREEETDRRIPLYAPNQGPDRDLDRPDRDGDWRRIPPDEPRRDDEEGERGVWIYRLIEGVFHLRVTQE